MKQLSLLNNKPKKKSYKTKDYILSEGNINEYQQLLIENWQHHCKILYGKPLTGKTHLAHVWQQSNNGLFLRSLNGLQIITKERNYIIENIEKITNERELLCIYNVTKECNCKLLLTTNTLPKFLPYKLADLKSRILSSPLLKLPENNEHLLKVMLLKEFSLRQIKISKEVIDYIINHTERSVAKLINLIDYIDLVAIEEKRNITVPLVRKIINLGIK
ncbi:MAG: chromosomal DNA replication initiator [Rickettsiaceae bacterium H1]|nr:chromosomal DNA replication initiator [Rickettsiaceae bacterium H1]